MAQNYKILGQANPQNNEFSDLYVVPSVAGVVVTSLTVTNTGSTANFSIAIRKNGETTEGISGKQWLAFNAGIKGYDTIIFSATITLSAGDKIQVQATENTIAFMLFGYEITT